MATTVERIGIVETKVENLSEKLDEMYTASCEQHAELAKKISNLEQIRQRMMWMVAGAVAFAGILSGHMDKILAFLH